MDIGSILGAEAAGTGALAGIGSSEMGREEFLRLLLVQLQMQDPLDPMEHDEMLAQLAQFSSLEQLESMNEGLEENLAVDLLLGQLLNNTMATTLIGKGVRVGSESFVLPDGESASLGYRLHGDAATVSAFIYDASGRLVATVEGLEGTQGDHTFSWDGRDDEGTQLPGGTYTFRISASDGGDASILAEEMLVGVVDGIRYRDGNALLVLGENELYMSDVLEVFEAS